MERHEILEAMSELKLYGMRASFDEIAGKGLARAVLDLLASLGITVTIEDCRFSGEAIPLAFTGSLRPDQESAITALLPHDTGVLAATTAFGKTILAIRMMAGIH
jgi:superfamily II DNA or RNA helicase